VRQLLTESVSLACMASVLGSVLAYWGSVFWWHRCHSVSRSPGLRSTGRCSWFRLPRVVLGVLCGLPPALMLWRSGLSDALKQDSRSQSAGTNEQRLGSLLIVGETALTVMLLIAPVS
jgi:hypothetical protein